ncbi:Protein of unknown function [Bacillus wiedmannii]|uniref:Uncharacterized protein n=1 Tax=Bacillus wiedmannii TaxID=1890302 RepID=A0AB37YMA7_9BACI|nr:Protein of unknown function [Bacillus wiedmannii]
MELILHYAGGNLNDKYIGM